MKSETCGLFFIFLFISLTTVYAAEEKQEQLERIIVTKPKVHLASGYSLSSEELGDLAVEPVIESLKYLLLDLQSRSPHDSIQTDFSLRASTFQGVLMLFNGSRINDPQTAHHNSDIPLTAADIDKVEVMPGVSSSVLGMDAIGGAVNFNVKKPEERKMILMGTGGQHETFSGLFSYSDKIKDLGLRFSVDNKESEGFRYDTDFKKFNATFASSLDFPGGELDLNWGYQEKEFGAYDFYTPGSNYPSKEWTKTYLLDTKLNIEKSGFLIRPAFLWRRHYDKFLLDKTLVRSRYLNHHRTDTLTPAVYLQKKVPYIGKVGLGSEYGEERINSTNLGKHIRRHKSVFVDDSKELFSKISLGGSFRFDDYDVFHYTYTGSLSAKYAFVKGVDLRLAASKSIRVPSFTELYYSDPTTLGNSTLSPEKASGLETGIELKREAFSFGASLFYRKEKNFIDWVKHSSGQAKWQVENITRSGVLGLENSLEIRISKFLRLNANYTYINKDIKERGLIYKYGPNYIKHLFNSILSIDLPFGRQSIALSYKKKPVRCGWWLLDLHFSYDFNKNSQIFLNMTNVFNVEYQEIEGIAEPGRWVEAGVKLEF